MNDIELKTAIQTAIRSFSSESLTKQAITLFEILGYNTSRQAPFVNKDYVEFKDNYDTEFADKKFNEEKALTKDWQSVDLLFQLSQAELSGQGTLFDTKSVKWQGEDKETVIETYLFFAIELSNTDYSRTSLAQITREINKVFSMPVMIVFKHGEQLTLSIINRRLNKKDRQKDVLEKVTLIKDISINKPHRAHIEILFDLSIDALKAKHKFSNFVELHNSWQKTLDTKELNNRFYKELSNWYFWAMKEVYFPGAPLQADFGIDATQNTQVREHNAKNLIRLLTRILFVWFIKEKGLIPNQLFNESFIKDQLIHGFEPRKNKSFDHKSQGSKYYRAILQNLFFATLNQTVGKREFRNSGQNMNVTNLMRYENYFKDPSIFLKLMEGVVPFMNGGLFECLDKPDPERRGKQGGDIIIYEDGFSDRPDNKLCVPDYIFFGTAEHADLSEELDDKRQKDVSVRGLINILESYKFTITENTPIEEDIALDPELLGRVFENLLASYNPETKTTARKQTGSFYTPREIVNYMVDESLKAYLKQKLETEAGLKPEDAEFGLEFLIGYYEKENPFNSAETKVLIKAIDSCKILDPACGSGAFPMGILHKLVHILHKLDPSNEKWKERQLEKAKEIEDGTIREQLIEDIEAAFADNELDYGRKLYLIENCIYGVDIQPIATQISKLRFFISLIVDQQVHKEKDNFGIRPLPNLETKFVAANTLIGIELPEAQGSLFDSKIKELENNLKDIRHRLFSTKTPAIKRKLRESDQQLREEMSVLLEELMNQECEERMDNCKGNSEIQHFKELIQRNGAKTEYFQEIKVREERIQKYRDEFQSKNNQTAKQITSWDPYDQNASSQFFDPEWMFGITDGFDVVIGNPPYGLLNKKQNKAESIQVSVEELAYYKNSEYYQPATGGMINIFRLFILRSIRLLSNNGVFSEIFPLAFIGDQSISNLRKYIFDNYQILFVEAFPERDDENKRVFEAVKMSVCILNLKNAYSTRNTSFFIRINDDRFINIDAEKNFLNLEQIKVLDEKNYSLPLTSPTETDVLKRIFLKSKRFSKLGKCNTGEIDMTFCKGAFSKNNNNAVLLKGAIIDRYVLRGKMSQGEIVFLDENKLFQIKNINKNIKSQERIVLQGITGVNEKTRLKMMIVKNAYCANSLNYLTFSENVNKYYILGLFNSKLLNFVFSKFSTNSNVNGYEVDNLPICLNNNFEIIKSIVLYILFLKNISSDSSFLDQLIDSIVYELYFPDEIKAADAEVLKHLTNLPELKDHWSDEQKLALIDKVYKELFDPAHPVAFAMGRQKRVPEIRVIEELDR